MQNDNQSLEEALRELEADFIAVQGSEIGILLVESKIKEVSVRHFNLWICGH